MGIVMKSASDQVMVIRGDWLWKTIDLLFYFIVDFNWIEATSDSLGAMLESSCHGPASSVLRLVSSIERSKLC